MYTNQQINEDYCIFYKDLLGSGSYAKVFGAKQISTNQLVCVKVIRITNENEKLLEREIEILKKLQQFDNPNLIKIYDITKQNNQILIFMERCRQTLGDYISNKKQQKQLLPLFEIIDIANQIINGYRDLYSHNIIHRDIKPENVLIGTDKKIKISDFGFGKILKFDSQFMAQTIIGTPLYVSPQALMTGKYSSKTDVYSFGMLIYFLIFQESYYQIKTLDQLYQKIIVLDKEFSFPSFKNQGNEQDSALLEYILDGCIKFHEKDRFNWEQLFQIFDQKTIQKFSLQSKTVVDIQSEQQFQQISQDQQNKTNQRSNQKPPLKQQNPENVNPFRISNLKQQFEKDSSSRVRQNKSQENNQTKTIDTVTKNMNVRVTQTPQRSNNSLQINYTTEDRSRKHRITYSNEKDSKNKQNKFIIKLQQKNQSKLENDKIDNKFELNNKQQLDKIEQIIEDNQSYNKFIKQKTQQDLNQILQINQDNDKDIIKQKNYETQINIFKKILQGIFAKIQLAENLASSLGKLGQILDYRLDLFRFLLINYQQSILQNIYSINNNEKNLLLYPLQNQLIEFIDPINYILDDRLKQKLSNLKGLLQKVYLKNQLALQQINDVLIEKEKYNVEDIVELIQTNAIKYNYISIVESYQNHYNKLLKQHQYDLSQIKSQELLKFLGYSTKFILSESLYSIEKLKSINNEEIPNLCENYQILEKFIKENCKINLKL